MNIKILIGKRLKELRKARKLSQEQLAEKIDVAQNTLSYIENGDNFFTAETLTKIINTLDIEPRELFEFSHYKDNSVLLEEINKMLANNPEKIKDIYKITKSLLDY